MRHYFNMGSRGLERLSYSFNTGRTWQNRNLHPDLTVAPNSEKPEERKTMMGAHGRKWHWREKIRRNVIILEQNNNQGKALLSVLPAILKKYPMVHETLNRSHSFRKWKMTPVTFPKVRGGPEVTMVPHTVPGWVVGSGVVDSLGGDPRMPTFITQIY